MVELAHVTGERGSDLKNERRRAQMCAARQVLERSTMLLLTSSKVSDCFSTFRLIQIDHGTTPATTVIFNVATETDNYIFIRNGIKVIDTDRTEIFFLLNLCVWLAFLFFYILAIFFHRSLNSELYFQEHLNLFIC